MAAKVSESLTTEWTYVSGSTSTGTNVEYPVFPCPMIPDVPIEKEKNIAKVVRKNSNSFVRKSFTIHRPPGGWGFYRGEPYERYNHERQ